MAVDSQPSQGAAREAELRGRILELVTELHREREAKEPFEPGRDRVRYAGRVFDDAELRALVGSALDFWLTLGPYGDRFEEALRKRFGARRALFVNSGSSANLLAVSALRSPLLERPLAPGDEVLTVAAAFPTTVAPIVQNGLTPVFVDVELGTYNADPALLAAAVGPRTRAIFLAHTLGNPFDLARVSALAEKAGLVLIEDCCDAFGGSFAGRPVGTWGDMATLSFYPAHHITTGEGGAVVVNKSRYARPVESLRDWGRDCWCAPGAADTCGKRFAWRLGGLPEGYDHKYIYSHLGYNLKPTDLQAAIGLVQLDKLDGFIARRRENFKLLHAGLARWEDRLILPRWHADADPSWFCYPVTVREGVDRRALVRHLEAAKIETRQLFAGNVLRQPAFAGVAHRAAGTLANTDAVMERTFFVGVYPGLTPRHIEHVVGQFGRFFAHG